MSAPKAETNRLGVCGVCKKDAAKYTCPACEIRSCSLACVQKHKKETECDGVRNRTSYVSMKKFSDLDILNDYRLLEEIGRCVDSCKRDKLKRSTRMDVQLPTHLHRLREAIMQRGSRVLFLPKHFSRHSTNTTFYDWKAKRITWRIQLTFLNANKLTFYINSCSEDTVLENIVQQYLTRSADPSKKACKRLEAYRAVGLDSIDVLMKTEKLSNSQKKFYKLNMKETLKKNFTGKTIVEFPILFVMISGYYGATPDVPESKKKKKLIANFLLPNPEKPETESDTEEASDGESIFGDSDDDLFIPQYKDLVQTVTPNV